ncbi:hypothetical protein [Teredinibacter purpureus]|uniref:hypothetical protein n=1 Tax=Teredinibacter purpureus TaxID=2731756 RepID=UPI0005F796ED|nr:hypothetical protein [Teredinibacter purpureus]
MKTTQFEDSENAKTRKTDCVDTAITRAVKERYGKNAEWFENSEISNETRKFGQIGKPCSTGGYNMITKTTYIDVEPA